jgi:hypothetical protein
MELDGVAEVCSLGFQNPRPGGRTKPTRPSGDNMLETIIVILLVLWLLGFFAFHIGGGLIHILLVIAIIVVLVRVISGRRAL